MSELRNLETDHYELPDLSLLYDHLHSIKSTEFERNKKGLDESEILVLNNLTQGIVDSFYGHLVMKVHRENDKERQMNYLRCLRLIFQF